MASPSTSTGFELRIIATISALVQIYLYAYAVLLSLFVGHADYLLPVKGSFFFIVVIVLVLSVFELRKVVTNWTRSPQHRTGIITGIVRVVSMGFIGVVGGLAIVPPVSLVDLRAFDWQVRVFVLIGIGSLVGFTFYVVDELRQLPRKNREIPPIAGIPLPKGSGKI